MARKKFRNQRHEPSSGRSFQEYLTTPAPQTSRSELMSLVRGGEDTFLELKVKLSNPERIAQGIAALANTGGGLIVFGVNDNLRVEGLDDPESVRDELVRICRENVAAVGAGVEDVDEAHLWSFVREFDGDAFSTARAGAAYPTAEVLERDLLLAVPAGVGVHGVRVAPTVAGLLLFGRDERVAELLPRAAVTATRYAGDSTQAERVETAQLFGNLHTLFESSVRFVERYCDLWDKRPTRAASAGAESPVKARANYHRGALLEAVANALAHRDLALAGVPTRLSVFDHSIEITNPRRTAGFAPPTQRAIRYGIPQRLNPQLAAIFRSPAYGLALAHGGLPMLLRQTRLFSTRRADINLFN